ncbi:MAG: ATP-dependent DNA ligase [Gaiellaceae bacterium]
MPSSNVPFPPMEAQLVPEIPEGNWLYEPKWDGFRGVVENDGGQLAVWSRNGRPLLRYFPELAPLGEKLPPHSALDGEIVLEQKGRLEFDLLQMRLHPAESRVRKLSAEIPVRFIAFDLLLWKGEPTWKEPLQRRRKRLERLKLPFAISQASRDPELARRWLERLEPAGLDGVVCKRLDSPYRPGSREAVVKVKHHKTVDCVVVGVRWKEKPKRLATLLLGLYDRGDLHYVGSCAVAPARHDATLKLVRPLLDDAPERGFSEPNRWGTGELAESALKRELVVEVRYDKVEKHRIRHGTRFLRFRPDKDPRDCTWAQVRPRRRRGDPTIDSLLA